MTIATAIQEGRDALSESAMLVEHWLSTAVEWSQLPTHLADAAQYGVLVVESDFARRS